MQTETAKAEPRSRQTIDVFEPGIRPYLAYRPRYRNVRVPIVSVDHGQCDALIEAQVLEPGASSIPC